MDNYQKRDQYADLNTQLKEAINNEFYYQAIFIEYAIIEDRTESILRHANIPYIGSDGNPIKLKTKINRIRSREEMSDKRIKKHLTTKLLDEIDNWRDDRNDLVHDLAKSKNDEKLLKSIALHGYELAKTLSSKSTTVNKYLDKKLKEEKE